MQKHSKKANKFFPFLLIFLATIISSLLIFFSIFQPVDRDNKSSVTFIIPKGQSINQIANRLADEKLIRSTIAFRYVVFKDRLQNKIQAGSFKVSPSSNTWEIAQILTKGTDDLWITLPEGWRREEIASSLAKQDLDAFNQLEFLNLTQGLEGQLFPDTYLVSRSISTSALVNLLNNTFESKIKVALASDLSKSQFSLNEVLSLASLIQRESASDSEMSLVAGILLNRLEINMPLQVDATLQYVKGYDQNEQSWWPTPLAADKSLTSAYNTYLNNGLPPGPICNPGFAAIKAVLYPQPTNALYYIHDLSGKIHTATDLDGHNRNVNQYLR